MNEKILKRLQHLFAMMGSSNAAERETARQKIDEILARHRKTWNDLTELLQKGGNVDPWREAWNDERSAEQHAGDAIKAGLPSTAVKEPPNVLELVHHIVEKYVSMKSHESIAVALWILHTHLFTLFTISPRLAFMSPVRGCGKTTALAVTEKLVASPERMDNATPAVIYHLIDRTQSSTLLLDEADNQGLDTNYLLRSVLNSGHRKGGNIRRVIRGAAKKFSTFSPMAIAAIGSLPLPLMQRSVIIHMEKSAGGSGIERFDTPDAAAMVDIVYGFVTRWARSNPELELNPDLPKDLKNRIADNWRPLISIADSFGSVWGTLARKTAITFARAHHDEDAGVILLSDLRNIFNQTKVDRMASGDLIVALLDIEESGWSEFRGVRDDQQPKKLTVGEMARLLRPFGIHPKSIWPSTSRRRKGESSRKGYYRHQFEDLWRRYCEDPADPDGAAGTPAQNRKITHIGGR